MRVRGFTQDDAHIFCRPDQLEDEIFKRARLHAVRDLRTFGFDSDYDIYLSTQAREIRRDSDENWEKATSAL